VRRAFARVVHGAEVFNVVVPSHHHTHDHIDWADRLTQLRMAAALDADALSAIARRLVAALPPGATILDVGCGAGAMSTHLAHALSTHGGGTLVLIDATPELLAAAEETARAAIASAARPARRGAAEPAREADEDRGAGTAQGPGAEPLEPESAVVLTSPDGPDPLASEQAGRADGAAGEMLVRGAGSGAGPVEIRAVRGDLADAGLPETVPAADLVWAARVVHHLPDQQAAVDTLARAAKPGGLVALAEGGLDFRCLPWDLGIGRPGLEDRLLAAQAEWFIGMREGIEGSVAMPYGWSTALERAGLTDVDSFGALVHHPSPGPTMLAEYVLHRVGRIFEFGAEHLTPDDRETLTTLLDQHSPHHLATRRDLYLTGSKTVHCGRRP
ncbi:MAG TPA: methyltransferase domain-containing protein, partial [Amycolatopsis sp.]|nr:methyltransferase domain-containing protein [Amycolatopsis sp.]